MQNIQSSAQHEVIIAAKLTETELTEDILFNEFFSEVVLSCFIHSKKGDETESGDDLENYQCLI